jgi:hypothetical protein
MAASFRVGLIAVAALAAVAHASARPECTAGTHTSGGVTYRTFCGPAHATLHDGGKTYSFSGGSCLSSGSTFSINIGTITLPPGKPKYDYFGITIVGAHPGTLTNQAVAWQQPHTNPGSLYRTTITLASGLKKGTFSGPNILGGGNGSGTFSCS